MPLFVLVSCLGALLIGYRFYAPLLEKSFGIRKDENVPSHTQADGIDFVPTEKHILFGHHFASIAGAAPILGPAIAIVWGWLPALIWIVFGVIFMGAAHDFGALVLGLRHEGRSVTSVSSTLISPRFEKFFMLSVLFLLWMVGAVFTVAIASLFAKNPESVLPVNIEIVIALLIGIWAFRYKGSITLPSLAALLLVYALIVVNVQSGVFVPAAGSLLRNAHFWMFALLAYAWIASCLPVWLLIQPRDLINSHQLLLGLVLLYIGLFLTPLEFHAPAIGSLSDLPSLFPVLMSTIACGAISGFHGLVSSTTTSKQLNASEDARPIAYGSMLLEATLAILATFAVACGVMNDGHTHVFSLYYDAHATLHAQASELPTVAKALSAFINGSASLLTSIGFSFELGKTFVTVLVVSFAATSLDTAVRIQRLIVGPLMREARIPGSDNRWWVGFLCVASIGALVYFDLEQGAKTLWPVFGATNQLLAACTLGMCAIYLKTKGRRHLRYSLPAILMCFVTISALVVQIVRDLQLGALHTAFCACLILCASFPMLFLFRKRWTHESHENLENEEEKDLS